MNDILPLFTVISRACDCSSEYITVPGFLLPRCLILNIRNRNQHSEKNSESLLCSLRSSCNRVICSIPSIRGQSWVVTHWCHWFVTKFINKLLYFRYDITTEYMLQVTLYSSLSFTGETTKTRVGEQSLKGWGVILSRALEWIVVFSKMGTYLGMVNVSKLSSLSSCTDKKQLQHFRSIFTYKQLFSVDLRSLEIFSLSPTPIFHLQFFSLRFFCTQSRKCNGWGFYFRAIFIILAL